jgi:hypothetical protein
LKQNQQLKDEYEKIVHEQLKDGVIEKTRESSTSERVFYIMPHKAVIKENASTTKVRMVYSMQVLDTIQRPIASIMNACTLAPHFNHYHGTYSKIDLIAEA